MKKKQLQIKPYTVAELARMYEVSDRTLKKWIKPFEEELGRKIGIFYTIAQVKIIFGRLGMPGMEGGEW